MNNDPYLEVKPPPSTQQHYQQPQQQINYSPKSRAAYIVLALFFGCLGIHNFYGGFVGRGITQLLIFFFGWIMCFIPNIIVLFWSLIEAICQTHDACGNRFI